MSNEVKFLHGKDMNLNSAEVSNGTFYITEETGKLFLGHNGKLLPLLQSELNEDQTFMEWFEWPLQVATTVNIYDSLSGNLIKTVKSESSSGITIYVNEIAGDGVSSIFFSEPDGDHIDQIDNSGDVINGSYEYYPSYAGLSLANDDTTDDEGDIPLNTTLELEPGKEYTYYLVYDGERVTIDGVKYWIPNHEITWSEAAENNLIPVIQGPYALVAINKNNSPYCVGDGLDWDQPVLDRSDNYDLYTYVESENDPVDSIPICGIIKGTNITWRYAISTDALNSEDIPCTIEDNKVIATRMDRRYIVKTPDGVAVSPDDVIISFAAYQLELELADQITFTVRGKSYTAPVGSTWQSVLDDENSELRKDGYFYEDYVYYSDHYDSVLDSSYESIEPPSNIINNENYVVTGTNVEIIIDDQVVTVPGYTYWMGVHYSYGGLPEGFSWEDGYESDNTKVLYNGKYLRKPDGSYVIGDTFIKPNEEYFTEANVTTVNLYDASGSYRGTLITSDPNPELKLQAADSGEIYLKGSIPADKDGNNDKWEYLTEEDGYGAPGYGAGIYVAVNALPPYGFSIDNDNNITSNGDIEWGSWETKYVSLEAGKTYTYYVYGEDDIVDLITFTLNVGFGETEHVVPEGTTWQQLYDDYNSGSYQLAPEVFGSSLYVIDNCICSQFDDRRVTKDGAYITFDDVIEAGTYTTDEVDTSDKVQIYKYHFTDQGIDSYSLTETNYSESNMTWYDWANSNGYQIEWDDNTAQPKYVYYELAYQKFYITDNNGKVDAQSYVQPNHRYDSGPILTPVVTLGSTIYPANKNNAVTVTIEIPDYFTIEGSMSGYEVLEWFNTTTGESGEVIGYSSAINSIGGVKTSHTPTSSGIYEYRYSASISLYDPSDSTRYCTICNHSTVESTRVEVLMVDQDTENMLGVLSDKGITVDGNYISVSGSKFDLDSNPWVLTFSSIHPNSDAPNYMHEDYDITHCVYNIDNPTAPTQELYYTGQNYGAGGWIAAEDSADFDWYRYLIDYINITDTHLSYETSYQTGTGSNPPNNGGTHSGVLINKTTFSNSSHKSFAIARIVPSGEGQITFTVCGNTYKANEGETWGDWINRTSPNNITNSIYIYYDGNPLYNIIEQNVSYDHVINPEDIYSNWQNKISFYINDNQYYIPYSISWKQWIDARSYYTAIPEISIDLSDEVQLNSSAICKLVNDDKGTEKIFSGDNILEGKHYYSLDYLTTCENCGKYMSKANGSYCSASCEEEHYYSPDTVCGNCGNSFSSSEHGSWCPNCNYEQCSNCGAWASEGEWAAPEAGGAGKCPSCGQ